jgi:hypothetical protein
MGIGTPAQQRLAKKFVAPFFNWDDDDKLREWLRQQEPDELEQFLDWFNFDTRRDRETLGRQELRRLRNRAMLASTQPQHPPASVSEVLTLKPGLWGVSVDLKALGRRYRKWWQDHRR